MRKITMFQGMILRVLGLSAAMAGVYQGCIAPTQLEAAFQFPSKNLVSVKNFPRQPMLRILLTQGQEELHVEVDGSHNIYDPYKEKKLESVFGKSSYIMSATADGMKWGGEFPGVYQLLVIPDSPATPVVVNGIAYSGAVAFYLVGTAIAAVNWVSLEDFTTSMLSSSLLPKNGDQKEALAAYAIALRSFGYQASMNNSQSFWNMKAADIDYKGKAVERTDKVCTDAIKGSKDVILNMTSGQSPSESIAHLFQKMPYEVVTQDAQQGKDARQILEQFFPQAQLTLLPRTEGV